MNLLNINTFNINKYASCEYIRGQRGVFGEILSFLKIVRNTGIDSSQTTCLLKEGLNRSHYHPVCGVRPRARFWVIFHIKILKNAPKSGGRVWKTHVGEKKRMKVMDTRLRFQFFDIFMRAMCLYLKENCALKMHIFDQIYLKNRSRLQRSYS